MDDTLKKLVSFVNGTEFGDLPHDAVHEMKRCLLDSTGCAVAGLSSERGKIAVAFSRMVGGTGESTIIGTGSKISCTGAAFANGELINALDFDALTPEVVHVVPTVIPAVLALAERAGASGGELILAIALGLEIGCRLRPATNEAITTEGAGRGKLRQPLVSGFGTVALAAASGASKILRLDKDKTANAIAIAGYICPPSVFRKFIDTAPAKMAKYGPAGWGAQAGVTAALLAENGYTGDVELFRGKHGFWTYTGHGEYVADDELEELGNSWKGYRIKYKQYPCGGVLAGVLDGFIQIMEDNHLNPEDVDEVVAQPLPIVQSRLWQENALRTPDDYSFNLFYLIACAAHGVNPVLWQDREVRQDPEIGKFLRRVKFSMDIDEKDFGLARLEDPRSFQMRISVSARGRTFQEKIPYVKGAWEPAEYRNTDEELIKKYMGNTSRVLSSSKAEQAAQYVLGLENCDNIRYIMDIISAGVTG